MGVTEDRINALKEKEKKILGMGGEKAVARHKEKGKLTARERLDSCLTRDLSGNRHVCDRIAASISAWRMSRFPPTA